MDIHDETGIVLNQNVALCSAQKHQTRTSTEEMSCQTAPSEFYRVIHKLCIYQYFIDKPKDLSVEFQ